MFHNVYDSNLYKYIDSRAYRIRRVVAEFTPAEDLPIFCKDIKDFLRLQKILNDFGTTRYTKDDSKYDVADYSIYVNLPYEFQYSNFLLTVESDCNEFSWTASGVTDSSGMDIDVFIDKLLKESGFATHKDQDGFLWKPSTFSPDWYCFVKGSWIKLEVEEHVKLVALL